MAFLAAIPAMFGAGAGAAGAAAAGTAAAGTAAGAAAAGTAAAGTAAAAGAGLGTAGWLALGSTVLGAASSIEAGRAADKKAQFEAEQLEDNAKASSAMAQREAIEERRRARLAQSRLQALAGGSGLDAGIVGLDSDLEEEGEYRAMTALYDGGQRAAGYASQASATRYEGKQAKSAGTLKAAGTALSGGSSLYSKYG